MELFETKIGDKNYSCYALSVTQAGKFESDCKRLFLDNLEKASGVDVSYFFGAEGTPKQGLSLFEAVTTFIKDVDFDDFYAFHLDCISKCIIQDSNAPNGATRAVDADKDLKRPENYQLFSWYVECQLGPFTQWLKPHFTKLKSYTKGVLSALDSSGQISTGSTTDQSSSESSG